MGYLYDSDGRCSRCGECEGVDPEHDLCAACLTDREARCTNLECDYETEVKWYEDGVEDGDACPVCGEPLSVTHPDIVAL